jgi:hypothetical protein
MNLTETRTGAGDNPGPRAASALPPPQLLCECPGCRRHVARLEEINRTLSAEIDRMRRAGGERRRAA